MGFRSFGAGVRLCRQDKSHHCFLIEWCSPRRLASSEPYRWLPAAFLSALIIGTGGFSHLLAFYYRRLGLPVLLASSNGERSAHLNRVAPAGLHYCSIEDLWEHPDLGMIHLCVPRQQSHFALRVALCHVRDGGCINAVSGFALQPSDELRVVVECLQLLRRANACATSTAVETLTWHNRQVQLSGHLVSAPW